MRESKNQSCPGHVYFYCTKMIVGKANKPTSVAWQQAGMPCRDGLWFGVLDVNLEGSADVAASRDITVWVAH